MKSSTWVWVVIVVIVIIGGIWYYESMSAVPANPTDTSTTTVDTAAPTDTTTASSTTGSTTSGTTVTYTSSGFSPSTITVPVGTAVTFVDQASNPFWIASDPHPTHTSYDGTSRTTHCASGYNGPTPFDECSPGTTYTFTFTKAGTFGYHDHMVDENKGTVVVTAQ